MENVVSRLFTRMESDHDVDGVKKRELYDAFGEFADAYNTFKNQQNIDNWKNAKDKQIIVLKIAKKNEPVLTKFMNIIWRHSPEFDNIHQNVWIQSELNRLRAPAAERYDPYNYIKRREEEERRRQEEERRRQEEEQRLEKYATSPAAGGSKNRMKLKNKSKKHSKKSRKSKSRRH